MISFNKISHPEAFGVTQTANGLLVAALNLWNGDKWQPLPLQQEDWGPSPIGNLFGFPVFLKKSGWRGKNFREMFYAQDAYSRN